MQTSCWSKLSEEQGKPFKVLGGIFADMMGSRETPLVVGMWTEAHGWSECKATVAT